MRKFTLFMTMLLVFSTTSIAQIASVDELSNDKLYWLQNWYVINGQENRKTLYYSETDPDMLWCAYNFGIEDNMDDPNQQFAILNHEGKYYLYCVAAKKFVFRKEGGLHLSETPMEWLTIHTTQAENADGYFCFAYNDKWLFGSYPFDGYAYCGYIYADGTNMANAMYSWRVYEVGDFDSSEIMAALPGQIADYDQAVADSKAALQAAFEEAEALVYDEACYEWVEAEPYPLQVADPEAPYYLSCSNVDPQEGSMEGLIDGDNSTFMHSNWHTASATNDWLDIDMGEGNEISEFQISEVTRSGAANDFPLTILIQGSNNSVEYTDITTVTGLPQSAGVAWESEVIKADQPYRYLRFVVTTGTNRIYFHMAEFSLMSAYTHSVASEAYESVINELKQLVATLAEVEAVLEDENSVKNDYDDALALLSEQLQYINDILEGGPDEEVLALVDEAKALLELPRQMGYPGEISRATLKAVIDEVMLDPSPRQRDVVTAAIEAFYRGTDAIAPEDGKKYVLTFVSRIDTYYYMNRVEEEELFTDSEGNDSIAVISNIVLQAPEEGVAIPETAAFTCRHNADTTLTFIADNGEYLIYKDGTASAAGNATRGIQSYEDEYTKIQLIRVIPSSYAIAENYEDFWGYVAWYSKRSDARGYGCIVSKTDGSGFDGASAPFYNDSFTSVLQLTEYVAGDTGIGEIAVDTANGAIYDLCGRRVESPVKGIYIVNGKKVLVK